MKFPSHPGTLIEMSLEELGIPVAVAARSLGVSRQHLHNVIRGKSAVSAEMAVRLEKGLGSTAETWLRMQASYDLAQILLRDGDLAVTPLAPKVAAD